MSKKKQIRFAMRWLKEQGLFRAYCANTLKFFRRKGREWKVCDVIERDFRFNGSLVSLLWNSFPFYNAPEGEKFWANIAKIYEDAFCSTFKT